MPSSITRTFGLLLAAAALLLPRVAATQTLDGTLRVLVPQPASSAGSTVTVVVTDTADASRRRTATVGDVGVAVVPGLAAGTYDVAVYDAGALAASGPVPVQAQWVSTAVIAAGGRIEVVDRHRIGDGVDFDERAMRDLPVAGDLWSLVETAAPFVVVDRMDTGGLGVGRSALVGGRGESWSLTTVNVDGMTVGAPTRTGLLPFSGDMNAVSSVGVSSGLSSVRVETPGVVIGVVPKRAGAFWQGGVDASVSAPGMVATNALAHAPSVGRLDTWRNVGAFAGGPVAARAGLFVSVADTRTTFFERDLPQKFGASATSAIAHLVVAPAESDQLRVFGSVERTSHLYDDRRQFADVDINESGTFGRVQALWNHAGAGGVYRTVSFGIQRGSWHPDVRENAAGGTMDRVLDGAVPAPPSNLARTQWDARIQLDAPVRRLFGWTHEIYGGVEFRRTTAAADTIAVPIVGEAVGGLASRVWIPVAPTDSSYRAYNQGVVFAGDRIGLARNLALDAGMRAEFARGSARGSQAGITWNTLSPRVSLRWRAGSLALFAGVGRYVGGSGLAFLSFGDAGEVTWDVHRWRDVDGDAVVDPGEAGVLVARAGRGPSVASLDPLLRSPRTTEWTAGAEYRPTAHSLIRGSVIVRRQTSLAGVINTGVSLSSYRLSYVPDINADEGSATDDQLLPIYERLPSSFGQDALNLTNPDSDPIAYDGVEAAYELQSAHWFMLFGATAYRAVGWGGALGYNADENDQLVTGDRFWNPNALKDNYGRLFFDRAYVGKWSVGYRGPWNVRTAVVARYQDGQPFTRYVIAPDLAGGPEIVQAYTVGRTRFTYTGTIDVRIEKGFFVRGRRLSLRLDGFNVTNHGNEVEENVLTGPQFRLSTAVQPPRTLRLGIRFEF